MVELTLTKLIHYILSASSTTFRTRCCCLRLFGKIMWFETKPKIDTESLWTSQMHEVFRTIKLSNNTTIKQPSINLSAFRKFTFFEGADPWGRWCYPAKAPWSPPGGVQLLLGLVKHLNEASENYGKNGFINYFNHTHFRVLSKFFAYKSKNTIFQKYQTPFGNPKRFVTHQSFMKISSSLLSWTMTSLPKILSPEQHLLLPKILR